VCDSERTLDDYASLKQQCVVLMPIGGLYRTRGRSRSILTRVHLVVTRLSVVARQFIRMGLL